MTPRTGEPSAWRLLPHFMLRQAGFAFDRLAALGAAEVGGSAADLADRAAAVVAARRTLLDEIRTEQRAAAWTCPPKVVRAVLRYQPLPAAGWPGAGLERAAVAYAEAARRHRDAVARFGAVLDEHRTRVVEQVLDAFRTDGDLRLALATSNPAGFAEVAARLDRPRRPGDLRDANVFVMYLQRLCAKNETNSSFGPFTPGRVDPAGPALQVGPETGLERFGFVTHWTADGVAAAAVRRSPALLEGCLPRVNPMLVRDGDEATLLAVAFDPHWTMRVDRRLRLDPGDAALLRRCDGSRTLAAVAAAGGPGAGERLDRLVAAGLLVLEPVAPVGDPEPAARLAELLRAAADRPGVPAEARDTAELAVDCLDRLGKHAREFTAADAEERAAVAGRAAQAVTAFTGAPGFRGAGELYADRAPLYEECRRDLGAVRVGGLLAETVREELGLYLDLLLLPARLRLDAEAALVHAWFTGRYGPGAHRSMRTYLDDYLGSAPGRAAGFDAVDEQVDRARLAVRDGLLDGWDGRPEWVVDPGRVRRVLADHPVRRGDLCNPDVMVAAADPAAVAAGDFRLVVGDCHAVREALSHTSVSRLLAGAAPELARDVVAVYASAAGGEDVADVLRHHTEKTYAQLTLPLPRLVLGGPAPPGPGPELRLDDLTVADTGERLVLRGPGGRSLRLMAPPVGGTTARHDPLAVFAFPRHFSGRAVPLDGRGRLPRLRMGRVVLQRATWAVDSARLLTRDSVPPLPDLPADGHAVLAVTRLRRELGLPRHLFAAVPGERKPLYLDLDAPALVWQLVRHVRAAGGGEVQLSEMLPGPEELWLTGPDGRRTSELRMCLFTAADRAPR